MKPNELITTLTAQHRVLQSDLLSALQSVNTTGSDNGSAIMAKLFKFKTDFLEHMKLENEVFYHDLLANKISINIDIEKTKQLIKDMDVVEAVVVAFLGKYDSLEYIERTLPDFKNQLTEVISMNNTRIETEEEELFNTFLLI